MDKATIREFANRERGPLETLKARYWRELKGRAGAGEGIRVTDDLRRYVITVRPDWPDRSSRDRDLQDHIELGRTLRRVRTTRLP